MSEGACDRTSEGVNMERCNYSKCKWKDKIIDLRDPLQFRKIYKGKKYHDICLLKLKGELEGNNNNG